MRICACYNKIMKKKEFVYQFETLFEPNGQGYTVTVPDLPGLVTEGRSLRDAREMARDAIRCHLEALLKDTATRTRMARSEKLAGVVRA